MAISRDLFLSILALDSYNRGYNPGIYGLSDVDGTQIGLATIIDREGGAAAQSVGFYATAYDVGSVAGFTGSDFVT